jgi:hypothetical protein
MIDEDPKKNRIRRHRNWHQKNHTSKDGWADYEGEVSRYEDRYPKKEISLRRKLYHQQRVYQSLWRTKKRRQYNKLLPQNQPHQLLTLINAIAK